MLAIAGYIAGPWPVEEIPGQGVRRGHHREAEVRSRGESAADRPVTVAAAVLEQAIRVAGAVRLQAAAAAINRHPANEDKRGAHS